MSQFAAPLTPPNINHTFNDDDEDDNDDPCEQRQAEDFLASQDAAASYDAEAASTGSKRKNKAPVVPPTPTKKPRKTAAKRHERDDSQQASQVLFPDDEEWEKKAAQVGILSNDAATFAAGAEKKWSRSPPEMKLDLKHGDVRARIHEETRDHVFEFLNDSLGKPILLFRQNMATLLSKILPDIYKAYDSMLRQGEQYDEGTQFCKTVSKNDCFKIVVEISCFQNSLYIFLKRMSKPEAIRKLPQFKLIRQTPYNGPTITPDAEGFVPSKGCCIQLDRDADDPATIMAWARECVALLR